MGPKSERFKITSDKLNDSHYNIDNNILNSLSSGIWNHLNMVESV